MFVLPIGADVVKHHHAGHVAAAIHVSMRKCRSIFSCSFLENRSPASSEIIYPVAILNTGLRVANVAAGGHKRQRQSIRAGRGHNNFPRISLCT